VSPETAYSNDEPLAADAIHNAFSHQIFRDLDPNTCPCDGPAARLIVLSARPAAGVAVMPIRSSYNLELSILRQLRL
jgi:hypothetical protein